MAKAPHQRIDGRPASRLRGVLLKPFPKGCIQRLVLRPRDQPGLLNEVFVGTEGNIFHTMIVYTISVYSTVFNLP